MSTAQPLGRDRYSRQALFWAIGPAGQERLRRSQVAVLGCGALGSTAVSLMARAGIGRLTIVDRDIVELSNLQRQVMFEERDAAEGTPKAIAAAAAVGRINADVEVVPVVADVTPGNVEDLIAGADVVIDGTDNVETRYLVNDACVKSGVPWVFGGAAGSTGMTMPIMPGETPCYRCAFPTPPPPGAMETSETAGMLASTVLTVAAAQWTEAIKILIGDRDHLSRGLTAFDVWTNDHLQAQFSERRPDCPCCGQRRFEYLDARATSRTASLCGRNAVQVSPAEPVAIDLETLDRRLQGAGAVTRNAFLVRFTADGTEITVFRDGRAIIKGTNDLAVARTIYARYVDA